MTADDDLTGRVDSWPERPTTFVTAEICADLFDQSVFGAQYGRHGTNAGRNRRLHELTALPDQMRAVFQAQRAGGHQGRVFTQAMSCKNSRLRATLLLP